jgi:hypothetical protein
MIMAENLRMLELKNTVIHMAFGSNFLLLLLLNKMGLWSGKIEFYMKWLE